MGVLDFVGRIFDAPPLGITASQCTAHRHHVSPCRRCESACPSAALTVDRGPALDSERCDACGLCAAACPAGALRLHRLSLSRLQQSETRVYTCRRAPAQQDAQVMPCLGCLTADHLICLGLARPAAPVILLSGKCDGCAHTLGRSLLEAALQRSAGILATAGAAQVAIREVPTAPESHASSGSMCASPGGPPEPAAATDDADTDWLAGVSQLNHLAATIVDEHPLIPPADQLAPMIPRRRTAWLTLARQWDWSSQTVPCERLPFSTITLSPGCNGCGMCARFCPSGSLSVRDDVITQAPEICLACGLCEALCPRGLISFEQSVDLDGLGHRRRRILKVFESGRCPVCGHRYLWDAGARQTACPACRDEMTILGISPLPGRATR